MLTSVAPYLNVIFVVQQNKYFRVESVIYIIKIWVCIWTWSV